MQSRHRRRGVALITALFFGVLCIGLATSFLLQVPVDLAATATIRRATEASYAADAGVQDSMAWISHELANSREPTDHGNPTRLRAGTAGAYNWVCLIEPDSGTPPNPETPLRIYRLTSTASLDGRDHYRIVTDVQAGQSFARFSSYVDKRQPLAAGDIWYDYIVDGTLDDGKPRYSGPIHKNDPISFQVAPGILTTASPPGQKRPFNSLVTSSAGFHRWNWDGPAPSRTGYNNIFTNGEADLLYRVPPRPLPDDSRELAAAAWGGPSPPLSGGPGVSVRAGGGVYIQGQVESMQMSVNGSGNFVLTVVQIHTDGEGNSFPVTTTVEEDASSNQRTAREGGTVVGTVPINADNNVIYVTGDIKSLQGTNKGARTIATNFSTIGAGIGNRSIEITGDILRADTPEGVEPAVTDDRLGLVTSRIWIAEDSVLPRTLSNTLYIYAHMTATDTFVVKGYRGPVDTPPQYVPSPGGIGAMEIYGGLATGIPWRTMRVNNATDLLVTFGYGSPTGRGSAPIYYDKLLVNEPPPIYPTTAGAELMVRSWRESAL